MRRPMSDRVNDRLSLAASRLRTADPRPYVGPLLERTFPLPEGDLRYADNTLTPGAAPVEPSFSEQEPDVLRFTMQPLSPDAPPACRRDEATREMRRLVEPIFGQDALRWFDRRSEEWRGMAPRSRLNYGAFFGTSYDRNGLHTSKVYYEMGPHQIGALPRRIGNLTMMAMQVLPGLFPIFTSIGCRRTGGTQRATFVHHGPLRIADLQPLADRLGLSRQMPGLMKVFGVALGGRFELPDQSVLLALGETAEGPELELYVLLGRIPDLPPTFVDLLSLGMAERPRELAALYRWLRAFTPESQRWPGRFSVLSVRIAPQTPARVSLYLRPVEFEIQQQLEPAPAPAPRVVNGATVA